jgi:hypothetical protein
MVSWVMNGLAGLDTYTVGTFMYDLVLLFTRMVFHQIGNQSQQLDNLSYSAGRAHPMRPQKKSMQRIGQAQQKKR